MADRLEEVARRGLDRMDEDGHEMSQLAGLIAGDDERLKGQIRRALNRAYLLGREAEWNDYLARTYPHPVAP